MLEKKKEKYYKISETRLKGLLRQEALLVALESGGVDNWEWYGESCREYLEDFMSENNISDDNEDFDFADIADLELENYKEVE